MKRHFCTNERLFELICIENDFAKYFAKCRTLLKYFISHIKVIHRNKYIFILQEESDLLVVQKVYHQSKSNSK